MNIKMKGLLSDLFLWDVVINWILGGKFGTSISGRLGHWYYVRGGWRKVVAYLPLHFLNLFEKDHCKGALEEEAKHFTAEE